MTVSFVECFAFDVNFVSVIVVDDCAQLNIDLLADLNVALRALENVMLPWN